MTVKLFVVERYLPGITADELRASADRLAAAAADLIAAGEEIRYLGSTFLPDEESCFCRLEAASAELVGEACRTAAFPYARILEGESFAHVEATHSEGSR